MSGIMHFETFLLAGVLLNLTAGNDTIFILSKSIGQGQKAGIVSALGISTGGFVHTILAAFGLSIIISESILIFNIIKYVGAAYLLYVGIRMLYNRTEFITNTPFSNKTINYWQLYRDGMLTNILNPKVALFFIAFLPQFIDPTVEEPVIPFLILGITFITTGTIWCLILATTAAAIFGKFKNDKKLSLYIQKLCGLALVALGLKVALLEKK